MNIKHTQIHDEVFGKCLKLEGGSIEIVVTLDFGPRIISFRLEDGKNMLFQDTEKKPLGEHLDIYDGDILKLYGGHRLWASPEILPRCYYPDNHSVSFTRIPNGFHFTAPVEEHVNIKKSFSISFWGKNRVEIQHYIKNYNLWEIELSPWAITMLQPGGVAFAPLVNEKSGYLPNRQLVFWDYADPSDARLKVYKDFYSLRHDADGKNFKMGTAKAKWASYLNHNQMFIKHFHYDSSGAYPDYGCNFEIYTNEEFLELESLGPIKKIAPNAEVSHIETWEIHKEDAIINTEKDIRDLIGKYINEYQYSNERD